MIIKNVTIVVRGEAGEIKKAMFDGDGAIMSGDVSCLDELGWSPQAPAVAPLDPDEASASVTAAIAVEAAAGLSTAVNVDLNAPLSSDEVEGVDVIDDELEPNAAIFGGAEPDLKDDGEEG